MGIAHTSRATAQRELADLVKKDILIKRPGGGRSASYDLDWERWSSFDTNSLGHQCGKNNRAGI
jgi:Fic family protein